MNKIIKQESAVNLFGVDARAHNVIADDATGRIYNQTINATRYYKEDGTEYKITVNLRFDDRCKNGHETFSITGDISEIKGKIHREYSCGCIHDDIAKHFPELAYLIKWHLVSTDGPMHYIANTMYHADEHGPDKAWIYYTGESDPLNLGDKKERSIKYASIDEAKKAEGQPGYRVKWDEKTAKIGNIEYARSCAVWPDATIEQLRDKSALEARLPALMSEFHLDMMRCGFVWPVTL